MADTDECDVLVVGLGPAGAAAATAAAKAGARVLAVERRQTPGGAANCPEFSPIPLGLNAHADHVVIQKIVGARNHLSDGSRADNRVGNWNDSRVGNRDCNRGGRSRERRRSK